METPTQKPDAKRVNIPTRYTFSDKELIELSKQGVQYARQHEALEKEFSSIKADFKLRLTNLENERDRLDEQIADGFCMRATECLIHFNEPTKGQKTIYIADTMEVVRTEQMSPLDLDRELPLKMPAETLKEVKVLPDNPDDILPINGETLHPSEPLGTSIGDALDSAAAKTDQPQVMIPEFNLPDWGPKTLRNEFKKAAAKAGWPILAVTTLLDQCKGNDLAAIRATLAPHVKGFTHIPIEIEGVGSATLEIDSRDQFGDFNGEYHLSVWGMIEPLKLSGSTFDHEFSSEERHADFVCRMNNAAIVANWPDAAKTYLAHSMEGATLEELVSLAQRLGGNQS